MAPGPASSGLRGAATAEPGDTAGALLELLELGADLREASWVAELESRWNPRAVNANGGATGLWQIMPAYLSDRAGVLERGSRREQTGILRKLWNQRAPELGRFYVRLFWPAAEHKPAEYVIAEPGSVVAKANPALAGADGRITVASVVAKGTPPASWPSSAELEDWARANATSSSSPPSSAAPAGLALVALFLLFSSRRRAA